MTVQLSLQQKDTRAGHRGADTWGEQVISIWRMGVSGPDFQSSNPYRTPQGVMETRELFEHSCMPSRNDTFTRDKAARLLTETSFLCFGLELHQLSVITPLILCWSEPLIVSHTWLWLIKNGKTNYYLINAVCLVDKNLWKIREAPCRGKGKLCDC